MPPSAVPALTTWFAQVNVDRGKGIQHTRGLQSNQTTTTNVVRVAASQCRCPEPTELFKIRDEGQLQPRPHPQLCPAHLSFHCPDFSIASTPCSLCETLRVKREFPACPEQRACPGARWAGPASLAAPPLPACPGDLTITHTLVSAFICRMGQWQHLLMGLWSGAKKMLHVSTQHSPECAIQ